MGLDHIDTFVYVMLENRSFDHLLCYLSTKDSVPPMLVEGLRDDPKWIASQANSYGTKKYPVHGLSPHVQFIQDPPHEEQTIALQIWQGGQQPTMKGFVERSSGVSRITANPTPSASSWNLVISVRPLLGRS
jgi:phospholipase C